MIINNLDHLACFYVLIFFDQKDMTYDTFTSRKLTQCI